MLLLPDCQIYLLTYGITCSAIFQKGFRIKSGTRELQVLGKKIISLPLKVLCGMNSVLVYPSSIPRAFKLNISTVTTCSDGETDDAAGCFKEAAVIVMF